MLRPKLASALKGLTGANVPRCLHLQLNYENLGAQIALRLPTLPTIYLSVMSARLRALKLRVMSARFTN